MRSVGISVFWERNSFGSVFIGRNKIKKMTESPNKDEVDARLKNPFQKSSGSSRYMTKDEFFNSAKYKMDHKDRGNVLIISNRTFTEVNLKNRDKDDDDTDIAKLKQRFDELGFKSSNIKVKRDLCRKDFKETVMEVADEDSRDIDCLVIVILSIGEDGVVYATDGTLEIEELFDLCKSTNQKRLSLADKPKIFIIQTEQGCSIEESDVAKDGGIGSIFQKLITHRIPADAHFLSYISTLPEKCRDYNGKGKGSVFVDCLSKAIEDYGNLDFLSICVQANGKLVEYEPYKSDNDVQIPCITSMLLKDLYFGE